MYESKIPKFKPSAISRRSITPKTSQVMSEDELSKSDIIRKKELSKSTDVLSSSSTITNNNNIEDSKLNVKQYRRTLNEIKGKFLMNNKLIDKTKSLSSIMIIQNNEHDILLLKHDSSSTSGNQQQRVIPKYTKMHNAVNQLILTNRQQDRQKKLQQFYSIYQNDQNHHNTQHNDNSSSISSTPSASSLTNSNTSLYYDQHTATLPINNKIQLLKMRFNQLNNNQSNNIGSTTSVNSGYLKSSSSELKQHHHHSQSPLSSSTSTSVLTPQSPTPSVSSNTSYPQFRSQHSQETIIEECKQSLDELMKASKWSMRSSSVNKPPANEDFNKISRFTSPVPTSPTHHQNQQQHSFFLPDHSFNTSNSYKTSLQLKLKNTDSPANEYNNNNNNKYNQNSTTPLIVSNSPSTKVNLSTTTPLLPNFKLLSTPTSSISSINIPITNNSNSTPTTLFDSDHTKFNTLRVKTKQQNTEVEEEENEKQETEFEKESKLNNENNNNNEILEKANIQQQQQKNLNRRSETFDTIPNNNNNNSEEQVQPIVTGLPPPSSKTTIVAQQQQQVPSSKTFSNLNNSESMTSLKSLVSSKSLNSNVNSVLPPPTPQKPTSRKSTPEPLTAQTQGTGNTNQNSKKKDIKEKRKRNNSWIANSFRKAFGKEKKKSIDDEDSSTNYDSNSKTSKKSISRRACASDDENQLRHMKTVSSSSKTRDSDSDYDENYNKVSSKFNILGSKIGKRTYRSESELLDENSSSKRSSSNNKESEPLTSITINCSCNTNTAASGNKKVINFNNFNTIQNYKSCSSILTSTNSNEDSSSTNSRSQKCNCANASTKKLSINDDLVTELKMKLTNTENKLTDIRLEALSSIHQVDQLKECLDKIKCEMISLRSENKILKGYLKEIKAQDIELPSNERRIKESFILETEQDECMTNKKFDNLLKSITSVNNNIMNYCYSYNFLLNDENETILRKAYVVIKCLYHDTPVDQQQQQQKDEICIINVDSKLKWKLMDGIIAYVFKRYLKLIDPFDKMGLSKNSIEKYNIGEVSRYLNDSKVPSLLPFGYLIGDNCTIEIELKDNYSHLDLMSYDTLIPKYLLEDYMNLVFKNKYLAITGTNKLGKTFLMRKIAQFISKHYNNKVEIIYYDLDDLAASLSLNNSNNSTKVASSYYNDEQTIKNLLLDNLYSKIIGSGGKNKDPIIILIDNFHDIFVNNSKSRYSIDIVQSIIKMQNLVNFYFIITIRSMVNANEIMIPTEFDKYFKRINLQCYQEPLINYLYRYLHKTLIKHQVLNYKTKEFNILMEKIIVWLIDIYKFLNEFIEKIGFPEKFIPPYTFMDIPFNTEKSETWFIQLWNYTIIPYLSDLLREKSTFVNETSSSLDFQDPTESVLNKYPWPATSNTVPIRERLSRLKFHKDICDQSQLSTDGYSSSKNNHRLFSMLLRLQQTTVTGTTGSNRKEDHVSSGFYESSASSSPKSSNSPVSSLATGVFSINMKPKIESSL